MWADRATLRSARGVVAALILAVALAAPAIAAGPAIGQVKTASGQVFVLRDGARNPAKIGDMVFEKDTLQTGPDGSVGVTFTDNTVFSTGPNSEIALAEYSF